MRGQMSLGVLLGALMLISFLLPYAKIEEKLLENARVDVGTVICRMYAHHYALLLSEANAAGGTVNVSSPPWVIVKVVGKHVDVNVDAMDKVVSCSEAIP